MEKIDQNWFKDQMKGIGNDDIDSVLESGENLLAELSELETMQQFIDDVKDMLSYLKIYRENPSELDDDTAKAIAFALLYTLNPSDGIPDSEEGLGFLDDYSVMILCLEMVREELDRFLGSTD